MYTRTIEHEGKTWARVNATKARRAYYNGLAFLIAPAKIEDPFAACHSIVSRAEEPKGTTFEEAMEDWRLSYWDQLTAKNGRYFAYWIPIVYRSRFNWNEVEPTHPEAMAAYDYTALQTLWAR